MKLLLIAPRLHHPTDRGDRLFAHRILETFVRHHEVDVLAFRDTRDTDASVEAIRALGVGLRVVPRSPVRSLLRTGLALLGSEPMQVAYYESARMRAAARSAPKGGYDIVLAQMVRMAPYGLLVPARYRVQLLSDSLGLALLRRAPYEAAWKRPLVRLEQERIARYEQAMTARYDESWLVSEEDRAHFPPGLRERLRVVPTGISAGLLEVPAARPRAGTLLFVGHLGVPHNVDCATQLAREILPRVRALVPGAHVRLVGPDPAKAVRALAGLEGVEVVGFVPDLAAEYARAEVFVGAPRFASGVLNKLIEALAAAVPVVTSRIGARGLGLGDQGSDLVSVADGPDEIARAVSALLADPARAEERAGRARAWVRQRFRWENALEAIADIGSRLAGDDQSRADAGHWRSDRAGGPRGEG